MGDDSNSNELKHVWGQKGMPVVLRRNGKGEKLRVRLPFSDENRQWLQNGRRTNPVWSVKESVRPSVYD